MPGFDLASLTDLGLPLVILSMGGDLEGSNVRVKAEYVQRLVAHNTDLQMAGAVGGFVALFDAICFGIQ
jgi:hypothetical protein